MNLAPITERMHPSDALAALAGTHTALAHPLRAKKFLADLVDDARELGPMLSLYPNVLYEPLENHYGILRGMGRMGPALIGTLFDDDHGFTWRGKVFGALLCAISPSPWQRAALARALESHQENRWIFEMALARNHGLRLPHLQDQLDCIEELSRFYAKIEIPAHPCRPAPTDFKSALERQSLIRRAYQQGGAQRARQLMVDLGMDCS